MKALKYMAVLVIAAGIASCNFDKYDVGGTVTGLFSGSTLVLEDNSGDSLTITSVGTFTFSHGVSNNDAYSVTVGTQPSGQACTVHNGSGTIDKAAVTNVIVNCTQAGRFAYVANQTASTISAYSIDSSTGALTEVDGSPFAAGGTGPVAVTVDPNDAYLYVVNNGSNTVAVFTITYPSGALTLATSAIPTGNAPTSVVIDPTDSYMYVTNSTDNTVSAYTLSSGAATAMTGSPYATGHEPFALTTNPGGNFLYVTNYDDNTVTAFAITAGTGELSTISGSPFGAGEGPVAIGMDPAGTFVYVANKTGDSISEYALNAANGALSPISGSPIATGSSPESLVVAPGGEFRLCGERHRRQRRELLHPDAHHGRSDGQHHARRRYLPVGHRRRSSGWILVRCQRQVRHGLRLFGQYDHRCLGRGLRIAIRGGCRVSRGRHRLIAETPAGASTANAHTMICGGGREKAHGSRLPEGYSMGLCAQHPIRARTSSFR